MLKEGLRQCVILLVEGIDWVQVPVPTLSLFPVGISAASGCDAKGAATKRSGVTTGCSGWHR